MDVVVPVLCCQPALVAFDGAIKEKVALVCTMELASQRAASDRSVPFLEIAKATRLPLEQVEWLLMRAMSLGLIKGTIDEVDQIVHISYIKVRLPCDLLSSFVAVVLCSLWEVCVYIVAAACVECWSDCRVA